MLTLVLILLSDVGSIPTSSTNVFNGLFKPFLLWYNLEVIKIFSKFSIGATAAIVTSMGLIAGLTQNNSLKNTIVASLLLIAIADNISDSLAVHIYKESEDAKRQEIASATYGNFILRFLIVFTFILIVLLLPALPALIVSSIWGLTLLVLLSVSISKVKNTPVRAEIIWHVAIALLVIVGSRLLGGFILKHIA